MMPKFFTLLFLGGFFSALAVPPVMADSVNPLGAGEQGFYVASIVTTAPLRICDLGGYATTKAGSSGWCLSEKLFDTNRYDSLSPQGLVDKNCRGATVESFDVLQWKGDKSRARAIVRFRIPQGGCSNPGSVFRPGLLFGS